MKNRKLIYTNKQVEINELITRAYKFKCKNGSTYLNIGDGYCIKKSYLIRNVYAPQKIRTIETIATFIESAYDYKID